MISYYKTKDNKVVAVIKDTKNDAYKAICRILPARGFDMELIKKMATMPNEFRQEVACDPRDTFDFDVGCAIAKKRILARYYRVKDKTVKRVLAFIDDAVATMDNNLDNYEY